MKCKFCNSETNIYSQYSGEKATYNCTKCSSYYYFENNELQSYWFASDYDGSTYYVDFIFDDNNITTEISIDYLEDIVLPGIVNLTPYNFAEKIKMILAFQ